MLEKMGSLTGGGGLDATWGEANSESESGQFYGGSGGHVFNFAPPRYQAEANQNQAAGMQLQTVAVLGLAVVGLWLYTRK